LERVRKAGIIAAAANVHEDDLAKRKRAQAARASICREFPDVGNLIGSVAGWDAIGEGVIFNRLRRLAILLGVGLRLRQTSPAGKMTWMEARRKQCLSKKFTRNLVVWATSFALSLAQWHHVVLFFGNDLLRTLQAEQGVLDGYPHWRLVQSRVLGPWLEEFLSVLFGFKLSLGHVIIAVTTLTLSGVVMFQAGRVIGGRQAGWSALLAFHVLFPLTMNHPWLYIWDFFVLLIAAVFMLLIVCRAPWWSFLLLMTVAFFNHDGALFIGVWMVSNGLAAAWANRRPDWGMVGGGALGSLGGILLVEYLRRSLLKGEIGWKLMGLEPPTDSQPYYFFVHLSENLNNIFRWTTHPRPDFLLVIPLTLVLALALAVMLVVRHGIKGAPLAIYAVTQVTALLLFTLIPETRWLLELVPFLCLGGMLAAKPDWDTT
jgi:hypothetical protein